MFESFKENRQTVYKGNIMTLLPYKFYRGGAVEYHGRLHILGGKNQGDNEDIKHYSWDGDTWKLESTLPYSFDSGSVVVYEDKIHIIGGVDNRQKHYSWNGTTWNNVGNLPCELYGGAIVYNDKIHGINFYNGNWNYHYVFDGNNWTYESRFTELDYNTNWLDLCIYKNKLTVCNATQIYQYSNSWSLFYSRGVYDGSCNISYNEWIYSIGGAIEGISDTYRGNGGLIQKIDGNRDNVQYSHRAIPYDFCEGAVAIFDGDLYLVGGKASPKVLFNLSLSNNFI